MRLKTAVDHTCREVLKPKLLDKVRARIRLLNYCIRTEDAYVDWVRRFVLFHAKRHPRDMGATEIKGSADLFRSRHCECSEAIHAT
jgi:hypothetical protein